MTPELNIIFDAAMKLPPEERSQLISKLSANNPRRKGGGDITKFFGTFSSGDTRSADNDKIDADLAREYLDSHEYEN